MSIEAKTDSRVSEETEQTVSDYLLAHPEFFEHHTELLTRLTVPHPSGHAVSLIERQVEVLRQQQRQAERKLVDLVEIARSNDALIERIHHLVLALLDTQTLPERLYALAETLRERFGADEITVFLFAKTAREDDAGPARWLRPDDAGLEQFHESLRSGKPHCGRLRAPQLEFLFGDQAGRVLSAALLPLGEHGRVGLLAIGSHEAERFGPTLGTTFLVRIAELIAAAIRPLLPA